MSFDDPVEGALGPRSSGKGREYRLRVLKDQGKLVLRNEFSN